MLYIKRIFSELIQDFVLEQYQLELKQEELLRFFSTPPKAELGDLAFAVFFIAKSIKKSPQDVTQSLHSHLESKKINIIDKLNINGPYINFYLNRKQIFKDALKQDFQYPNYQNKTIVIDYSSPNIAKPIAIHHIRSTIIGNIIGNMFEQSGADVKRINYLGDWGTQFGKLIVAFKNWGSEEKLKSKGIKHLLEIYIKYHQEETPELLEEARLWFKKTEDGDAEGLKYWETFKKISIEEFNRIYKKLNVKFTHTEGESFYRGKTLENVIKLVDNKIGVKKSEGALIVDLDEFDMPPLLLKKQDGSTLYATRDLAAAFDRVERFNPDELLYVVASQQDLYFKQLFKTFNLMKYDWADKAKHINFGLLTLPGGKMSTREGKIVFLEDVLDEAESRVLKLINEKNPDLENKTELAKKIGVGAIIFSDISRKRKQNIVFKWEEVLNFDGETAPYVQYSYARAKGILLKNQFKIKDLNLSSYNISPYEFTLSKKILEFEEVLEEGISTYEPFVIARFVLEIAKLFNKYYYEEKISDISDENIKQIKLAFINKITEYIKELLGLLGIDVLERM